MMKYENHGVHGIPMPFIVILNLVLSAAEGAVKSLIHKPSTHPHPVHPVEKRSALLILDRLIISIVRTLRLALGGTVPLTTLGQGVTPLDPESPHGYWLLRNRAAFAYSGVATPALVAPHPWVGWRYELLLRSWVSWRCNARKPRSCVRERGTAHRAGGEGIMAVQCAVHEPERWESWRCNAPITNN
jgi:hypothetical protein